MSVQAFEGVWIDYSYPNRAAGLMLTLRASWGSLLVSALTVAATTSGGCAWAIMAYALHQYRSRGIPADALFLQTQVILRNPSTAPGAIWEFLMLMLTWKGHAQRGKRRLFSVLLMPLAVWLLFTAAGVFVGKVATPAYKINNILLAELDCGTPSVEGSTDLPTAAVFSVKTANDSRTASAYVDNCYGSIASGALGCSNLAVKSLPHNESTAECPFGGLDRCLTPTLVLDSGFLDSNNHLGINAKPADRILFRMVNTCSVLSLNDLMTTTPDPDSANGSWDMVQFFLGSILGDDGDISSSTYTYQTRIAESGIGYTLNAVYKYGGLPDQSVWAPIPDLDVADADETLLFFAAGNVTYLSPVLDPFFSASGNLRSNTTGTAGYLSDQYVNVMACTEQRQYCDATKPDTCTSLSSYQQSYNQSSSIGLNYPQIATAGRIKLAAFSASLYNTISGQGANALQANKRIYGTISTGLPEDQWVREASHWFQTALANLAQRVADFPTNAWNGDATSGLSVRSPLSFGGGDIAVELNKQCRTQRVQSTDAYINFSFVGVLVIVVVTLVLIPLSWTLEACVSRYANRRAEPRGAKRHKLLAAVADGRLSLLHMALQGANYEGWEDASEARPWRNEVGVGGQAPLPLIDPVHESDGQITYKRDVERGFVSIQEEDEKE